MKTSTRKPRTPNPSLPNPQTPAPDPTLEEIRQCAHDIYLARGGQEGLALNDWLAAEQQIQRKSGI
jgi:hypothetical protein